MNHLNTWRFAGTLAIILSGFLLHYVYAWSGYSKTAGLFVPVNESVWEHLKLGYWAVILLVIPEYFTIGKQVPNYFFARFAGVAAMQLTILAIFYGYTFFTGENYVLLDIFSYIVGAVVCQQLTYALFRKKPLPNRLKGVGLPALITLAVLFAAATYYPPHLNMFKDNNDETFGIHKEK